jgi:hypothetical protein
VRSSRPYIYGIATEPHILIEIENIKAKLAELQGELATLAEIIRLNPYRGLSAFREEDELFFFGREPFTAYLTKNVQQKPFVAVVGPSGSGKSSIIFARLIPELRRQGDWLIAPFRLGHDPFRALAAALMPLLEPALTETARLVEVKRMTIAGSLAHHLIRIANNE